MGLFTKIFKVTAKSADDLLESKSIRKAASKQTTKVTSAIKDLTNKNTLKTSSAIAEQGVSAATSGGRKIAANAASNLAEGAGTTAKIGGKVIAGTGIAAIPALTGLGIYNYYKDSTALTDEDRRLDFLIEKQKEAQDIANSTGNSTTPDPQLMQDPTAYGNTGVGGGNYTGSGFNPFMEAYRSQNGTDDTSSGSGFGWLGILGVAAAGVGGYALWKNSKKKGKK